MGNEENVNKILDKVEEIDKRLYSIDMTLIKQHASWEVHMARTTTNEKLIEILVAEMAPVKKHVNHIEGGFKLLGLMSLLTGITGGLLKVFGVI